MSGGETNPGFLAAFGLVVAIIVLTAWFWSRDESPASAQPTRRRDTSREPVRAGNVLLSTEETGLPSSKRIGMIYGDANGEITERVIRVVDLPATVSPGDSPRLKAWCELRDDVRTFRIDRIIGFFDPDTGESLSRVTLAIDEEALDLCNRPHQSVVALLDKRRAEIEALGWRPRIDFDAATRTTTLGCFRGHKRTGATLKHPSITLEHEPRHFKPVSIRIGGRFDDAWASVDESERRFFEILTEHKPSPRM